MGKRHARHARACQIAPSHPQFHGLVGDKDGYEMTGEADVGLELPVEGIVGQKKVKDTEGREWHCLTPVAVHFGWVKDEKAAQGGQLLKEARMFTDSGPARSHMSEAGKDF